MLPGGIGTKHEVAASELVTHPSAQGGRFLCSPSLKWMGIAPSPPGTLRATGREIPLRPPAGWSRPVGGSVGQTVRQRLPPSVTRPWGVGEGCLRGGPLIERRVGWSGRRLYGVGLDFRGEEGDAIETGPGLGAGRGRREEEVLPGLDVTVVPIRSASPVTARTPAIWTAHTRS